MAASLDKVAKPALTLKKRGRHGGENLDKNELVAVTVKKPPFYLHPNMLARMVFFYTIAESFQRFLFPSFCRGKRKISGWRKSNATLITRKGRHNGPPFLSPLDVWYKDGGCFFMYRDSSIQRPVAAFKKTGRSGLLIRQWQRYGLEMTTIYVARKKLWKRKK